MVAAQQCFVFVHIWCLIVLMLLQQIYSVFSSGMMSAYGMEQQVFAEPRDLRIRWASARVSLDTLPILDRSHAPNASKPISITHLQSLTLCTHIAVFGWSAYLSSMCIFVIVVILVLSCNTKTKSEVEVFLYSEWFPMSLSCSATCWLRRVGLSG